MLHNPKLASKSKIGEQLRKQLESVQKLMARNHDAHSSSIPQWLGERITVALGVAKPAPAAPASS